MQVEREREKGREERNAGKEREREKGSEERNAGINEARENLEAPAARLACTALRDGGREEEEGGQEKKKR